MRKKVVQKGAAGQFSQLSPSPVIDFLKNFESREKSCLTFFSGLMTYRKFLVQTSNWSTSPKFPIFKMAENHHSTHFHMWRLNFNAYNLYIVAGIYPCSFTNVRFWKKIEFSNVIFRKKKDCKIVLKWRWVPRGTLSFTAVPWEP